MVRNFLFSPIHETVLNLDNPKDKAKLEEIGSRAENSKLSHDSGLTNRSQLTPTVVPKKQKFKYQLEKELEELKKRNDLLVKHQTPLPDNVENVKYNKDVGFFQGEITGKQYDASKALKMKDHWERIHPQDQNTLKRIERIKYEQGETNIKPPFVINEEHKIKDQLSNNIKPKRRDTWKEFEASGGKVLPKLSPEEIESVRGERRVRNYMLNKNKQKITNYPKIEVPSVNLNTFDRKVPSGPELPVREQIKVLADEKLEKQQKAWDQQHGRGGLADMLRPT